MLQQDYRSRCCPICLENFDYGEDRADSFDESTSFGSFSTCKLDEETERESLADASKSVDKFGIPIKGADGKRIKMLRCGHIFCETCFKQWVHSGCGNPCNCPVCRQDVGKNPSKRSTSRRSTRNNNRSDASARSSGSGETILSHPSYDAVARSRADATAATASSGRLFAALEDEEERQGSSGGERAPLLAHRGDSNERLIGETFV